MASRNQYTYTPGYVGGNRSAPARSAPVRSASPGRQGQRPGAGAPRKPAAPAKQRPMGDTVVLTLLFVVAPLCGLIGFFVDTFKWVFVGVALLVLAAMWALKCFEQRGRAFMSGVLMVLAAVALIAVIDLTPKQNYFPTYGSADPALTQSGSLINTGGLDAGEGLDLQLAGGDDDGQTADDGGDDMDGAVPQASPTAPVGNNPALAGLISTAATATPPIQRSSDEGADEKNQAIDSSGTATEIPGGTIAMQTSIPSTEAETVMEKYMQMWQAHNYEDMVQYTLPSWQNEQTVPQRQLYWNHSGFTVNSWTITTAAASGQADAITMNVYANLTKRNGQAKEVTMKYEGIVINVNGNWYVDPQSMRSGLEATPTPFPVEGAEPSIPPGPTPEPTISPSTQLWYNTDGGIYYHAKEQCSSIDPSYYSKMKSFTFSQLGESAYSKLQPCTRCGAPKAE